MEKLNKAKESLVLKGIDNADIGIAWKADEKLSRLFVETIKSL